MHFFPERALLAKLLPFCCTFIALLGRGQSARQGARSGMEAINRRRALREHSFFLSQPCTCNWPAVRCFMGASRSRIGRSLPMFLLERGWEKRCFFHRLFSLMGRMFSSVLLFYEVLLVSKVLPFYFISSGL